MQKLPLALQFYFDLSRAFRMEKEAKGTIKDAGLFTKSKLLSKTQLEIENNCLMRRQLVLLGAKGEYLRDMWNEKKQPTCVSRGIWN